MSIREVDLGNVRGDINDSVATFSDAATRTNIASGETGKTIFGKIKKWFADMTISAFSTVVNNATTTVANTVLDGRMGKNLQDGIDTLNRNIDVDGNGSVRIKSANTAMAVTKDGSLFQNFHARNFNTDLGSLNDVISKMYFDVSRAWENPVLASACYVNLDDPYGDWNKPCVIQSNTIDAPPDMAWGIREVLYISSRAVMLRVTGVKTDGGTMCIWVRAYNYNNWTAWREC